MASGSHLAVSSKGRGVVLRRDEGVRGSGYTVCRADDADDPFVARRTGEEREEAEDEGAQH